MSSSFQRPRVDRRRGRLRALAVMAGLVLILLIAMFIAGNITVASQVTPTPNVPPPTTPTTLFRPTPTITVQPTTISTNASPTATATPTK